MFRHFFINPVQSETGDNRTHVLVIKKNALFYKTEHGAQLGDLFMSIIHTCNLAKVNPFYYLIALQEHSSNLAKHPDKWMPWNYKSQLSSLAV